MLIHRWLNRVFACFVLFVLVAPVGAEDPLRSGVQPGRRPGPYTSIVSVGNERGTLHCYICEAEDRPIAIVFARSLSEPLAKLVQQIDKAAAAHREVDLRPWVTFLNEDQPSFDAQLVAWARDHSIRNVPMGVYEDLVGPPSYLLSRDADVTVLLSVKQRVVANFAFRQGELNDEGIQEVMDALPKIVEGTR